MNNQCQCTHLHEQHSPEGCRECLCEEFIEVEGGEMGEIMERDWDEIDRR